MINGVNSLLCLHAFIPAMPAEPSHGLYSVNTDSVRANLAHCIKMHASEREAYIIQMLFTLYLMVLYCT